MAKQPQLESTDIPGIREVSFVIREALVNGLSPDERLARNAPYAETMQNLQATPFCAATPDDITQPSGITNGLPLTDWTATGVPVIVKGEQDRWLLGATQVSIADSSWNLTPVGATFTAGGVWQSVFFQEIPFFTNGSVFLWGTAASRTTAVTVNAVGKDENRLLLGGLDGSVFSSAIFLRFLALWKNTLAGEALAYTAQAWDTGWVLYGERKGGSSDRPFDAILAMLGLYTTDNQNDLESYLQTELGNYNWGLCMLRYPGAVLAFHELTTGPVAFGENGVCRMKRTGGIYQDDRLHSVGIGGRGCVGGYLNECLFLTSQYELWKVGPESAPKRVQTGFSNYMINLTLANTTISYDPTEEVYRIADKTYCYILNKDEHLSGPFDVYAQNVVRDGNYLYGLINDRTEKVTNGGFDSGSGWSPNAGWAISGGVATATASLGAVVQTTSGLIQGQPYVVRFRVTAYTGGSVHVGLGGVNGTSRSAVGSYVETVLAGATQVIGLGAGGPTFTGSVDAFSITPLYLDVLFRSTVLDNNERGQKHLAALQIGSENILSRKGGLDYRYDDADSSNYPHGPYTDATPAGGVFPYPRIEYVDGKIVVSGKVARGTRARLERINVQYQRDDITLVRGV